MKVIIQIPCFNEEATLPLVLRDLPRELPGVSSLEWLIIDDGSSDSTAEVARAHGVDHVVRLPINKGLATAFLSGLDACIKLGADVIVNTDGDNQYCGKDVGKLVEPIVNGSAEMVVGDRQVSSIPHFSRTKIILQRFGSWVMRRASTTTVADAPSGFRAFSREVAMRTTLNNPFSYTLETIIQTGAARRALASVPIRTNPKTRESRLFRGIGSYLKKSASIILRIYTMQRPLKAFFWLSMPFFLTTLVLVARWFTFYLTEDGPVGHVQSLIAATITGIVGVQILLFGLLGDLLSTNRRLTEEVLYRIRDLERVLVYKGSVDQPWANPTTAQDGGSSQQLQTEDSKQENP